MGRVIFRRGKTHCGKIESRGSKSGKVISEGTHWTWEVKESEAVKREWCGDTGIIMIKDY